MKLFNSQLVVIVRGANHTGTLTLKVTDTKLNISESIDIQVMSKQNPTFNIISA